MSNQQDGALGSDWDQRILELLACPICQGDLRPEADGRSISCAACRRVYPIEDGIPILIADRATGSA